MTTVMCSAKEHVCPRCGCGENDMLRSYAPEIQKRIAARRMNPGGASLTFFGKDKPLQVGEWCSVCDEKAIKEFLGT